MVIASIPTIGAIAASAAIDSINPCAIGVLILLISTLFSSAKSRKRLLRVGFIYITAVYGTYLLAGLGLVLVFSSVPLWMAEYISVAVGILVIAGGVIEIKDFYWYGKFSRWIYR